MDKDHVYLRQTPLGRWMPAVFYSGNLGLWVLTAMATGVWNLLLLALLPVPALAVYLMRTGRNVS